MSADAPSQRKGDLIASAGRLGHMIDLEQMGPMTKSASSRDLRRRSMGKASTQTPRSDMIVRGEIMPGCTLDCFYPKVTKTEETQSTFKRCYDALVYDVPNITLLAPARHCCPSGDRQSAVVDQIRSQKEVVAYIQAVPTATIVRMMGLSGAAETTTNSICLRLAPRALLGQWACFCESIADISQTARSPSRIPRLHSEHHRAGRRDTIALLPLLSLAQPSGSSG